MTLNSVLFISSTYSVSFRISIKCNIINSKDNYIKLMAFAVKVIINAFTCINTKRSVLTQQALFCSF